MRARYEWNLGRRTLQLGSRTLIVGVINITPDSFSDGGQHFVGDTAIAHGLRLLEQGADILDVGGESTRPGALTSGTAPAVSAEEELARVMPVIKALKRISPDCIISIDTYKSEVAREAITAGAEIVNDVSALTWDEQMGAAIRELGCGAILMHTRGRPAEWRNQSPVPDPVSLVYSGFSEIVERAFKAGIARDRIVLDPGFGFGKSFDENYPLLAHFDRFSELGFPLLSGTSRKSFLGRTLGRRLAELRLSKGEAPPPALRTNATVASGVAAILKGAHLLRVHDVRAAVESAAIADAILAAETPQ